MYVPPHFAETRVEVLHEFMRLYPLAALITRSGRGLEANHIPVLMDGDTIRGHVARANPVWKDSEKDALAIFTGPQDYISPSWYEAKNEHGRVVPTWNYAAVHAHGTLTFFEDRERLREVVTRLTAVHEGKRPEPWKVTDAPVEFIDGQLGAIVGFEMRITRLEGKWKASQNRSDADRRGVVEALESSGRGDSADLVRDALKT